MQKRNFFIAGGAGFIGSHLIDSLLKKEHVECVTIYDNFSSGRRWHLSHHSENPLLKIIEGDVKDRERLSTSMQQHDTVVHLASNPDISKAIENPDIDFTEGTLLTRNVLEAMRENGISKIWYISGSGVYGDFGNKELTEDHSFHRPLSTYAASKLAGEGLLSAYSFLFGWTALVFRFANVVGARQTHGVGFDFINKLLKYPKVLKILGDGSQSKSYIDISDISRALLLADQKSSGFQVFNVATDDFISVREIASIAIDCLGLSDVRYEFTGGPRGWAGDIPVVRLNSDRMKNLGWRCQKTSAEAIRSSLLAMVEERRIFPLLNSYSDLGRD